MHLTAIGKDFIPPDFLQVHIKLREQRQRWLRYVYWLTVHNAPYYKFIKLEVEKIKLQLVQRAISTKHNRTI